MLLMFPPSPPTESETVTSHTPFGSSPSKAESGFCGCMSVPFVGMGQANAFADSSSNVTRMLSVFPHEAANTLTFVPLGLVTVMVKSPTQVCEISKVTFTSVTVPTPVIGKSLVKFPVDGHIPPSSMVALETSLPPGMNFSYPGVVKSLQNISYALHSRSGINLSSTKIVPQQLLPLNGEVTRTYKVWPTFAPVINGLVGTGCVSCGLKNRSTS